MMSRPLTVFPRLRYWGVMNFAALGGAAGDDDEAAAAAGCGAWAAARAPRNESASRTLDTTCASFLRAFTVANPVMGNDQPPVCSNAGRKISAAIIDQIRPHRRSCFAIE